MDTTSILVSVVIPTYNRAHLLPRAVESVLAQTHDELEVVIVDDNSFDDTPKICHDLANKDGRVRLLRNDSNMQNAARNEGIRIAKGDVIAFLDDDDSWEPQKLEVQLPFSRDYSVVGCLSTGDNGMKMYVGSDPYIIVDLTDFYWNNRGFSPSTLICTKERLDAIGWFDPNLTGATGIDVTANLMSQFGPGILVNQILVARYTQHGGDRITQSNTWMYGCEMELEKNWALRTPSQRRYRQVQLSLHKMNRSESFKGKKQWFFNALARFDTKHPFLHLKLVVQFIILPILSSTATFRVVSKFTKNILRAATWIRYSPKCMK